MTNQLSIPQIVDLASAFYGSSILFSAIETGLFDAIETLGGKAKSEQIAAATHTSERGMRLLLDGATSLGLLRKEKDYFFNTESGKASLIKGSPADLTKAIAYNRDVYPLWGNLTQMVKTGAPVEKPQTHLGFDPERTKRFAVSMRSRAFAIGQSIIDLIDLKGAKKLLDLAGGPAAYAELLVRANPNLCCTTVDVEAISKIASEFISEAGLSERIECRPGDYHTDIYEKEEYDAVTLFGCLHQESPEDICSILGRAHAALKPGGKIFILDMMTNETHTSPQFSALFGVNMALSMPNGWVFSDTELKEWLTAEGFEPNKTQYALPPMPHWLVSAKKI